MTSDFSHFEILCQEKKIDVKMCACDSDLKLVAFLQACHSVYIGLPDGSGEKLVHSNIFDINPKK